MRNLLAFTLLFLLATTISAQGSETQILGNWKFNDFANKEKIPTAQIDMMKDMFKDIVFQFDNTKKYQFGGMSKTEKGNWVIEDKSTLKLTSEKGIVTKIKIVKIDEQFLVIDDYFYIRNN